MFALRYSAEILSIVKFLFEPFVHGPLFGCAFYLFIRRPRT